MRTIVAWSVAALAIAAAAGLGSVRAARAQAIGDDAPKREAPAPDPSLQRFADEFEEFLLQKTGFASLTAARGRINYMLARKLTWIDRAYGLSEDQKQRLQFAARGDIRRLEDSLERERQRFVAARGNGRSVADDARPEIDALRRTLKAGPFGEQSLLAKIAIRVPTPEQINKRERRRRLAAHSNVKIAADNAAGLMNGGRFHKDVVRIAWTAKANEVACMGWEKPLEICSADDFRRLRTFGAGRKLVSFDLSARHDLVALGENSTKAFVLNGSTGKEIALETKTDKPTVSLSPDGKFLATAGFGTHGTLWSTESGARIRDFDTGAVMGHLTLAFSPNGRILAIGNRNSLIRLCDVATGTFLRALPLSMPSEFKFDFTGKRLAATYAEGYLAVWDVDTADILRIIKTPAEDLYSVDWSPDGKIVASAGLNAPVTLWEARTLTVLNEIESPEQVSCVRFNPDGTRLIFAGGSVSPDGEHCVEIFGVPQE
jgi:hypothetical protein